jgi:hypothetical protein
MSIFLDTNHLFLRNPVGGVEDVANMKSAGFEAIFCNIGDYHPDEWDVVREQAEKVNVVCGPWLRTQTATDNFSTEKLDYLIATADAWNSPLIVNSETELKGSGDQLTKMIADKVGDRDAAVSVEAWPFANVDWRPIANLPVLPQIFPVESQAATKPDDCKEQWHKYGIKCVVHTFGAYRGQKPSDFSLLAPFGVYAADDCNNEFKPWSSTGKGNPCVFLNIDIDKPPGDVMAEIGTSHGITAFMKWLRKQEGVPTEHSPDYKPNNPATWPWPERFERTLNMLREDHDERN